MTQASSHASTDKKSVATAALAVAAVGLHVSQTPAHALWAAVEAAAGGRISSPAPAASMAECIDEADLLRAATLRGVFRHWSFDGKAIEEFVESYPVLGDFQLPTRIDRRVDFQTMGRRYTALLRRSLQDGVGMAFHDIFSESAIHAGSAHGEMWKSVFEQFDRHAELPALLAFSEDGQATRSAYGGWPLEAYGERPDEALTHARQLHPDLCEVFAGLMLTRASSARILGAAAPYVVDASRIVPFENGAYGRTAHAFLHWKDSGYPFTSSELVPAPWTTAQFRQFDAMPVLAWVHAPQAVGGAGEDGMPLSGAERAAALGKALQAALEGPLGGEAPARILYDVGVGYEGHGGCVVLMEALRSVLPAFDLLDVKKGYDLRARLGDTGAATAFVGVGLASMAAWETASTALVVHAREGAVGTVLAVKPPGAAYRKPFIKRPYDPT